MKAAYLRSSSLSNSLAIAGAMIAGAAATGQAANILVNPSFEAPAASNFLTNNLGLAPTGWSQTGPNATWNIIRLNGQPYGSGPDLAADGSQILDLNGVFTIFQNFTLTQTANLSFGASFSNREAHDGSAPSTVGIYDASGTTLLSQLVAVDTSAAPTPSVNWALGQSTMSLVAPGNYQIRIALNNFNNVDAVFVDVASVPEPASLALLASALPLVRMRVGRRR